MVEFARSRLLDEPLKAAIAEMDRNAAEGRIAAARRVIGEELDSDEGRRGVPALDKVANAVSGLAESCPDESVPFLLPLRCVSGEEPGGESGRLPSSESELDERELERAVSGCALGLLLGGVCWVAIVAGLWWLSRQPADVIVRLLAGSLLILGSVLIGYGLAWMEKRGG